MIIFKSDIKGITKLDFEEGFFEGWIRKVSNDEHLTILKNSYKVILAIDTEKNKIIGFINSISDGLLFAYIPLLEVIKTYRKKGIGSELLKRMIEQLKDFYAIDLICDENLTSFYKKFEMIKGTSMMIRNYNEKII